VSETFFVCKRNGNEAELRLVGYVVGQALEDDGIADLSCGRHGLGEGRDTMLARDRQAIFSEELLRVELVEYPPAAVCRKKVAQRRAALDRRRKRRRRLHHVTSHAVDRAQSLPSPADLNEAALAQGLDLVLVH